MNKQAILFKFLSQKHGMRLISRGIHNTTAYYNLRGKGLMKANRYGDVTFYPRSNPDNFTAQMYLGQLDIPVNKQMGAI